MVLKYLDYAAFRYLCTETLELIRTLSLDIRLHISRSPVIKAASEKLAALKSSSVSSPSTASEQPQSSASPGLPSASEEVLEAQRKRFEELKVCFYNQMV